MIACVLHCCCCVCLTASHYAAILFPHSPGAVRDLARSAELANIVAHFVEENSKQLKFISAGV